MKSSSLSQVLVNNEIISPSDYRDSLIHSWKLPPLYRQKLGLFIVVWAYPDWFFRNSKDGEFFWHGKRFSITFVHPPEKIRRAHKAVLSIRYCDMLERGYVLVKVEEDNEIKQFNIRRLESE